MECEVTTEEAAKKRYHEHSLGSFLQARNPNGRREQNEARCTYGSRTVRSSRGQKKSEYTKFTLPNFGKCYQCPLF